MWFTAQLDSEINLANVFLKSFFRFSDFLLEKDVYKRQVIACHERLRLGAVHLVHRVAGYQVDAHGVFQRFVKIGVESQDRGVFQRFRFVQIKTLDLPRDVYKRQVQRPR